MQRHLLPHHRGSAAALAARVEGELWGSWVELRPLHSVNLTTDMALAIREEVARRYCSLNRL